MPQPYGEKELAHQRGMKLKNEFAIIVLEVY